MWCMMLARASLLALTFASTLAVGSSQDHTRVTCARIADAVSSHSQVFYPNSSQYAADIAHDSDNNSQNSTCSVEPGTANDVGIILQILGKDRTPFAVKGGGHTKNQGFSSTPGVQIAMSRFSTVKINSSSSTVDVGAGLLWDEVYEALDGSGVNVVGGRVAGVGVAGLTLGGGYSLKTNQYGLALDNIAAYELVLPNGTVTSVTNSSGDLWFALRGGLNNFGIVTKFTLVSHPQTDVWGGLITCSGSQFDAVSAAVSAFDLNSTDKKAQLVVMYSFSSGNYSAGLNIFYDAPTPPSGIFDALLAIPSLTSDVSTRSFISLVKSSSGPPHTGISRGSGNTVSILKYTPAFLQAVQNATQFWSARLTEIESTASLMIGVEPFDPALYSYSPSFPSAYPPTRAISLTPLNLAFSWIDPSNDAFLNAAIARATVDLRAAALQLGQAVDDDFVYGNYASGETPVEKIYGANVGRLREIKRTYDPEDVMGLAGGYKF